MSKKDEIIELACDALQRKGVSGFSFRDLADAVGVKSSSVHYHFKTKNDLFLAIVEKFKLQVVSHLQGVEENSESLEESLSGFVAVFESVLAEDKFCVCGMLAAELKHLDQSVVESLQQGFDHIEVWLVGQITKYKKTKVPAESIARLLIASCEGALLIDRVDQKGQHFQALRESLDLLLV